MRVISFVPSWTETLIEAGVEVVGRTRFCVHPREIVKRIPVVGGTKDVDWQKVATLKPDLLIFDREENPKSFAEESRFRFHASHVKSVHEMPEEMRSLRKVLAGQSVDKSVIENLRTQESRWRLALSRFQEKKDSVSLNRLPAALEYIKAPPEGFRAKNILYVIWKNPDMAASADTFIGSVFGLLKIRLIQTPLKYPEFDFAEFAPENSFFIFSSEPFPFHKKKAWLNELPYYSVIVDGESYSWFGIRSLRFLEHILEHPLDNQF